MKNNQIIMTEGSILGKLLAFSIPLILTNLLQILFNAADIIVVGRFAGENSLAAVGSTTSLIQLFINLFVGLSIGTNVVAANYFGAGNSSQLKETVHTAILLSIYSGIIITVCGIVFSKNMLHLMGSPDQVINLAALYLKIYFAGITSTMVYNFGSALLRAKGDTTRPLVILMLAGILNLLLNLIFVICFRMDVAGVAAATVISQTFSAVCIIIILVKEKDDFHLNIKQLEINREILLKIIRIGVPAGVQGIIFSFSNVIIQSSVNSFGNLVIAGNSASMSIEGFVYTSMNGIAQGSLTFCSQNAGAGKTERIKKSVTVSQLTVIVTGLLLGNLTFLFSDRLLSIFTDNPEVLKAGKTRLSIICTTYFLCGMMDCMANSIRGIGYSFVPMLISLIGVCGLRILWIFTGFRLERFHSISCIYYSYPVTWIVSFIAQIMAFLIVYKKFCKLNNGVVK